MFLCRQVPGALLIVADPTSSAVEFSAYGCMNDPALEPIITHMVRNVYAVQQLRRPPPNVVIQRAKGGGAVPGQEPEAESYLVRRQLAVAYKVRF